MNIKTQVFLILFIFSSSLLSAQYFVENTADSNIDHVVNHIQFMGGGAAFFDADNDGDDDLYITSGDAMDHFYTNNGDGTFNLQSEAAGFSMTDTFYTIGVIAGDIDNDGFKDLFVTTDFSDNQAKAKNLLFKNNGDGTFSEIWDQELFIDKSFTMGATFLDYNQDGLLDIYAINYVKTVNFIQNSMGDIIGFDHECYRNTMYLNEGNGQFSEKSQSLNLIEAGCGLAVTSTDYDLDGDMDIYIANDFGPFIHPNALFQNNYPNPFFQNTAQSTGADIPMYGMGIAVGDIDGDLDLDYYVTNFGKNRLLRNDLNGFTDITDQTHVGDEWVVQDESMAIGWGTAFFDFDNDSDLDLYVANGFVPSPSFLPSVFDQPDKLFRCEPDLTYSDIGNDFGIENTFVSRGMAYSDYDNDGDLDVLSIVLNAPLNDPERKSLLFTNQLGNEKNWVKIRLEGVTVNRDAYGSKVYVYAGGEAQMQELSGGASHCSHHTSVMHFGMDNIDHIDSIEVVWTGGQKRQKLYDLEVNQTIDIEEDVLSSSQQLSPLDGWVNLYPNPAQQQINLAISGSVLHEDWQVSVWNNIGVLVGKYFLPSGQGILELDVSNLPSGLYNIRLNSAKHAWTQNFLINR